MLAQSFYATALGGVMAGGKIIDVLFARTVADQLYGHNLYEFRQDLIPQLEKVRVTRFDEGIESLNQNT